MKFYLNHKSLPMIRKCGNCVNYHKDFMSCGKSVVTNAYDHGKKIYLTTGENLYCDKHEFRNEEVLKTEAMVVVFNDVKEAMKVVNQAKESREQRNEENY
jgi:hypothetical protein